MKKYIFPIICVIQLIMIVVLTADNLILKNELETSNFPYYKISDEKYLNIEKISDLDDSEKYRQTCSDIEKNAAEFLLQIFECQKTDYEPALDIDPNTYEKIIGIIYGTADRLEISDEKFQIHNILVRCNGSRAVVSFTYSHSFSANGVESKVSNYEYPSKLYLELSEDKWIVKGIDEPL